LRIGGWEKKKKGKKNFSGEGEKIFFGVFKIQNYFFPKKKIFLIFEE